MSFKFQVSSFELSKLETGNWKLETETSHGS